MHLFKRAPKTTILLSLCLLLTGCAPRADSPEARFQTLRDQLRDLKQLNAQAELTADYGERVYSYTVDIAGTGQVGTMTVTEPENIAGTVLQWSDGSTRLTCEEVTLETGPLPGDLSPAQAVPVLLACCEEGTVLACGWEDDKSLLCAQLEHPEDDSLTASCWFDADTLALRRCELARDGQTVLTMNLSSFALETGADAS